MVSKEIYETNGDKMNQPPSHVRISIRNTHFQLVLVIAEGFQLEKSFSDEEFAPQYEDVGEQRL